MKLSKDNNLLVLNPFLAAQWHPTKNGDLKPDAVTIGSKKKVWWQCPKIDDHEWDAAIYNRTKGTGCPYCAGKKVSKDNNLLVLNPALAAQWHPTKNGDLKPDAVMVNAHKKVWWQCPKIDDHEWDANPNDRNQGSGCPYCAGKKVSKDNNLLVLNPVLAGQWHPIKNGDLKPDAVTIGSAKKVWWQCPKSDDHEWDATIASRTEGNGCPYCSGRRVSKDNNLLVLNPALAAQWHPTKNGDLKPDAVTISSHKKVWWQCLKSDDHEWDATIKNRTNGTGCRYCRRQTSESEIRILTELTYFLNPIEVIWGHKIDKIEIDIFIPKYNIGIEYDGSYWHKKKIKQDLKKNESLKKKKITLIRVREHPLKPILEDDIVVTGELTKTDLNALILTMEKLCAFRWDIDSNEYLNRTEFTNEVEFKRFLSFLPSPPPEYSLAYSHPTLSSEWHFRKNHPLQPKDFTYGSHKKVWWQCPKIDDHEWDATIDKRANGRGCPYCAGKKVSKDNNLLVLNPALAAQWHPTKNGDLKPDAITSGSNKKVWWQCPKSDDHEWDATIATKKKGRSCPYCSGRRVSKDYNLLVLNPFLASQWHPTKNGDLKPDAVTSGSNKKVWWQCPKIDDHEWDASIKSRTRGSGCPYCAVLKRGRGLVIT